MTARCKCGHGQTNHTRGQTQCWSAACGCVMYRAKETPSEAFEAPMGGLCRICDGPIGVGERVAFYRDKGGVMDIAHDGCIGSGE